METKKTGCFCQICKKGEIVEKRQYQKIGTTKDVGTLGKQHYPEPRYEYVHLNYHCDRCGIVYEATESNGLLKYEKEKTVKNPA